MIIKKLIGKRFARHESIEFSPAGSVVGFIGPNGSGKSAVLDLIEFLITGESSDDERTLDMFVKDYEGNASGTLEFVKGGKTGLIFRQIGTTAKRELKWDGRVIKSAKEVDATIAEIFGANKKAIANGVFINQGKLNSMLFSKGADRKQMFIQIVNLDFCANNARILDGKIKKIESTIVDLGPTRDAAAEQRRIATEALDLRIAEFEATTDWQPEIDFIAKFDARQSRIQWIDDQINRLHTAKTIADERLNSILANSQDTVDGEAALRNLTQMRDSRVAQRDSMTLSINEMQTLRAEFTHLDRVERSIHASLQALKELEEEVRRINPENLTLEEWKGYIRDVVQPNADAFKEADRIDAAIKSGEIMLREQQQLLDSGVVHPELPEDHGPVLLEINAELQRKLNRLQKMLATDIRIKKCFAGKDMEQPQECPDCGLKVLGTLPLSELELRELKADIQRDQEELNAKSKAYQDFVAGWNRYYREISRIEGVISKMTESLDDLNRQRQDLVFITSTDRESAFKMLAECQAVAQRLVVNLSQQDTHKNSVHTAMAEKANYRLALKNRHRRNECSSEVLAKMQQQAVQYAKEIEDENEIIKNITSAISVCRNIVSELAEHERQMLEHIENKPASSAKLDEMLIKLGNDWQATRAEVSALQANRQWLHGRLVEAGGAYDAANKALHDIEDRIGRDADKLRLLEDLRRARTMLLDDGVPMTFVKYQFQHLTKLTQDGLNKMNADFTIEVDPEDDLNYVFRRLDITSKVSLSMVNLSGGQKVRLCLAFLMAVQKRLVSDIGLLVLDEPLVHLDQAGREAAVEFIKGLNTEFQNTEMQVWVVDHHPELKAALTSYMEFKNT